MVVKTAVIELAAEYALDSALEIALGNAPMAVQRIALQIPAGTALDPAVRTVVSIAAKTGTAARIAARGHGLPAAPGIAGRAAVLPMRHCWP